MVAESRMVAIALLLVVLGAVKMCSVAQTIHPPRVIAAPSTQAMFDSATRWAREKRLETGGCAKVLAYSKSTNTYWIGDSRITGFGADSMSVFVPCNLEEARWHTHYMKPSSFAAGCERGGQDYPLGWTSLELVICGVGADSVHPWFWRTPRRIGIAPQVPAVIVLDSLNLRSRRGSARRAR